MNTTLSNQGSALLAALLVTVAVTGLSMIAVQSAITESRAAGQFRQEYTTSDSGIATWQIGVMAVGCEATPMIHPRREFFSWSAGDSWDIRCPQLIPLEPPTTTDQPFEAHFMTIGQELRAYGQSSNANVARPWFRFEVRAETAVGQLNGEQFHADWRTKSQGYTYVQLYTDRAE